MTQAALIAGLIFIAYMIGYVVGRKQVVDEIRELTKELKEKE